MIGFIYLHRKFTEWEWWDEPNTCRVFLWLALNANYKANSWRGVDLDRGQLLTSVAKISDGTGLSARKVRTALKNLHSTGEITSQTTNRYTIVTVCNYNRYNSREAFNDKPNDKPGVNQTTSGRQTSDKEQEVKEVKEEELKTPYNPPSHEGSLLPYGNAPGMNVAPGMYSEEFREFWNAYPNAIAKRKTAEAWNRALNNGATVEQIMAGIETCAAVNVDFGDNCEPLGSLRYLDEERWLDTRTEWKMGEEWLS